MKRYLLALLIILVTTSSISQNFPVNNLTATGTINSTGAVTAPTFIGNLTGTATSAGTASTVTSPTQSAITSVGTLTGLTTTGSLIQSTTGSFYTNSGGIVNKLNDRLLVGSGATSYNGFSDTSGTSWLNSVSGGIYEYLELNSVLNAYSDAHGIGQFNAARTSVTGGSSNNVAIGAATFANNDYVGGGVGAWGNYSTVIKQATATGPTQGMEIDVANMGSLVSVYPNNPHASGLTGALSLESGGESTIGYHVGTSSYAIGIGRNDSNSAPTANFDKGIVFDSNSLSGDNGVTGTGVAIALAKGHELAWYNNSNALTSIVRSDVLTSANGTGLIFNDYGSSIINTADGSTQFQVSGVSNAINRIGVQPSLTGLPAQIQSQGGDSNIGIQLTPKGTGFVSISGTTPSIGDNSTKIATTSFESANQPCLSILSHGGNNTGSGDNTSAFAATIAAQSSSQVCIYFPPGNYSFSSAITYTLPTSNSSITIKGAGSDVTNLSWVSNNGLQINYISAYNSAHIKDLSILAGTTNAGSAIGLNQTASSIPNPALTALSDITNVTIRGTDGYANTNYWVNAVYDSGVSNVNFESMNISGSGSTEGYGIVITGTSALPPVQFNIDKSNFNSLSAGVYYGPYVQGMAVTSSNFVAGTYGIEIPVGINNLDQLTVSTSQFNTGTAGMYIGSGVANLLISNNLFIVGGSANGITINSIGLSTITGNSFNNGGGTGPNNAIAIGTSVNSWPAVIANNSIDGMRGVGIWLQSSTSYITTLGNIFADNGTNVLNQGTNNTIEISTTANALNTANSYQGLSFTTTSGDAINNLSPAAGIEHGSTTTAGSPYIDFHSSGNANDYDSRIIASGGTTNGSGTLSIIANTTNIGPTLTTPGIAVGTGGTTNTGNEIFSLTKDSSALNYSGTSAIGVIQLRDASNYATNTTNPGFVFQYVDTGNGVVTPSSEYSSTIWWGTTSSVTKSGDGSGHAFTAVGQLGAYGSTGYNELGGFEGQLTNTGSNLGTMSGAELLLSDSPNGGTNSYSTKMQAVVGRIAKYNSTTRPSYNFYASSEGTLPPNAILGLNPTGNHFQRGFDLSQGAFSTGQVGLSPNNTTLAWLDVSGASQNIIGVDASNETYIRPASAAASTIIQSYAGANVLQISGSGAGIINYGQTQNIQTSAGIEHGSTSVVNTPYMDWHSSGNNNDYDVRVIASGGSSTIGSGTLNVIANSLQINGQSLTINLSGISSSIGGSALASGACSSSTISITGSTTSMGVNITPNTYPGDNFYYRGYVSTNGTVTIKVCASVAGTPTSSTYNVRVIQ